jgi:hypothetical protein
MRMIDRRALPLGSAPGVVCASPVQSFLFGHCRAEVVYDCR